MISKNLKNKNLLINVNKNILLKTLVSANVNDQYVAWLNDYEITKYTEQKYFKHTLDKVKSFVIQKYNSNNELLFGIFFNKIHIGNIKLGPVNFEHLSAEVSYFIGEKKYWGKGVASKCVEAIVNYALKELDLKKINAGYYENNIGSAKVLKKCGFVIEGEKNSEIIFEDQRIKFILVGYF